MILSKSLLPVILPYDYGTLVVQRLTVHPVIMGQALVAASIAFFSSLLALAWDLSGAKLRLALPVFVASALYLCAAMLRVVFSRGDPKQPEFQGLS